MGLWHTMNDTSIWVYVGTVAGTLLSMYAILRALFFTKSEINTKFANLKQESDTRDEAITEKISNVKTELKNEVVETKDSLYKDVLAVERSINKVTQEIYDRLNQNKQILDDYNKHMIEALAGVKSEGQDISIKFTQLLNDIKDELKNDYINRYNELFAMMNTKVNIQDFDRLENKFDKVSETIAEVKTIVQIQMEERKNKKQ